MIMADSLARVEHKSPMLNPRTDSFNSTYTATNGNNTRSPMIQPSATHPDKSPMIQPSRNIDKSPLMMPTTSFTGEEGLNQQSNYSTTGPAIGPNSTGMEAVKPLAVSPAPQLLVEVERIPKRMQQQLKLLPELASVTWNSETGNANIVVLLQGARMSPSLLTVLTNYCVFVCV